MQLNVADEKGSYRPCRWRAVQHYFKWLRDEIKTWNECRFEARYCNWLRLALRALIFKCEWSKSLFKGFQSKQACKCLVFPFQVDAGVKCFCNELHQHSDMFTRLWKSILQEKNKETENYLNKMKYNIHFFRLYSFSVA